MTIESVVWDEWYPVAIAEDVTPCKVYKTRLLGHSIEYACDADGRVTAWHGNAERTPCKALTRYHTHWVSLGDPPERCFALPEFDEPDRRTLGGGSMTVHVSGLRAIENFLDMAHFPYVHDGFLGAEQPLCVHCLSRAVLTEATDVPAVRLLHTPQDAQDARIEVWLGRSLDYLPVRLMITEPDGDRVDSRLSTAIALPTPSAAAAIPAQPPR